MNINDTPHFVHAHELPAIVRSIERIPENLHQEESFTIHQNTTRGMSDQSIVSELSEEVKDKEIVLDKDGERKLDKNIEDKTKEILKKIEEDSANITSDIKNFAKDMTVEQKEESTMKEVDEVLDDTSEVVTKKANQPISGVSDLVTRIDPTLCDAVSKMENIAKAVQPDN